MAIELNEAAIVDTLNYGQQTQASVNDLVKSTTANYQTIGAEMRGAVNESTQEFNQTAVALSAKLDETQTVLANAMNNALNQGKEIETQGVNNIG